MNFMQQMQLKALPQEEKVTYLQSIMPGISNQEAIDWLSSLDVKAARINARLQKPDKIADLNERMLAFSKNLKPEPPPEPVDYFARDILVNQYIMGGPTKFDEASMYNPNLKETKVIRFFRALKPKTALLIGTQGSGKTWGAMAWMTGLCKAKGNGLKVEWADAAFITAFRLAEMFHNQKKFQDEMDQLRKKRNLLIDDLGAEPTGFRGNDFEAFFDNLISDRHLYNKHTFITSNASAHDQTLADGKIIPGLRSLYGDRVISRLRDDGHIYQTDDVDMRGIKDEV